MLKLSLSLPWVVACLVLHGLDLSVLERHLLVVGLGVVALAARAALSGDRLEVRAALLSGLADLGDHEGRLLGAAGLDLGGDQALDLGALQAVLLALLGHAAAHHHLAEVGVTAEVEQLADLTRTLGAQALRSDGVGETLDLVVTLLGDGDVEERDITRDDGATDVLATALAVAATERVEADGTALHQQGDTAGHEHAGDHGETVLVATTAEAEDVALELVAKDTTVDLATELVVGQRDTAQLLVRDLELLHHTGALVIGNVELHDGRELRFELSDGERKK
ncbi:small subunit ribosomal protein S6e [Angomonas deanei]|nr:small subunit ribosomal protein S6e [Angomonas deanei]|eukprot:EPY28925.1 small subunit ribosomal protein S6e [Angomonas deanei]